MNKQAEMKSLIFSIVTLIMTLELKAFSSCKLAYTQHIQMLQDRDRSVLVELGSGLIALTAIFGLAAEFDLQKMLSFTGSAGLVTAFVNQIGDQSMIHWREADQFADWIRLNAEKLEGLLSERPPTPSSWFKINMQLSEFEIGLVDHGVFLDQIRFPKTTLKHLIAISHLSDSSCLLKKSKLMNWKAFFFIQLFAQLDANQVFCKDRLQSKEEMLQTLKNFIPTLSRRPGAQIEMSL